MDGSDLLSTAEACRELFIARSTLTRWIKAGKARPVNKVAGATGAWLFERQEVERLKTEIGVTA